MSAEKEINVAESHPHFDKMVCSFTRDNVNPFSSIPILLFSGHILYITSMANKSKPRPRRMSVYLYIPNIIGKFIFLFFYFVCVCVCVFGEEEWLWFLASGGCLSCVGWCV